MTLRELVFLGLGGWFPGGFMGGPAQEAGWIEKELAEFFLLVWGSGASMLPGSCMLHELVFFTGEHWFLPNAHCIFLGCSDV